MSDQPAFRPKPGDNVHWMHSKRVGRSIELNTREGVVISVGEGLALVRMRNNHKKVVAAHKLRPSGVTTHVNDVFNAMAGRSKPEAGGIPG